MSTPFLLIRSTYTALPTTPVPTLSTGADTGAAVGAATGAVVGAATGVGISVGVGTGDGVSHTPKTVILSR